VTPDFNLGALPFLGVASDLGTRRWRVGLGLYAPNGLGASLPDDEPTRYHATDVIFVASRATLAAACEVTDRLSVGVSASLVYTYLNAHRVLNAMVLADPDQRFLPLDQTAPYDHDLAIEGHGWTGAFDVGLLFRPFDPLRLGLVFASGSPVTLDGDVTLTAPDGTKQHARQHTRMTLPFTLKAGLNWEFAPDFEVGLDVIYWHYQVFQEQVSTLSTPLLGLTGFRDPKDFGNSVLWNVGLVYHVLPSLEVMGGFQQDFTPTPTRTYALESPARDSMGVALGSRWQIDERWRVGAAFNRIWFALTDVQDSLTTPPTNAKGYGGMLYFAADVACRF
jgi:long-subunit fatty acid transport protein